MKTPALLVIICLLNPTLFAPGKAVAKGDGTGIVKSVSPDITIRIGGTLQPRFTYSFYGGQGNGDIDTEQTGFGLRRMRLRVYTDIGDYVGVFLQLEGSGTSVLLLDGRGEFYINDQLTIRLGRFAGAQPRAYARTTHSCIDAADRPAISDIWARMTIGADGRDYGLEAFLNSPHYEFRAFLHNGYNQNNFRSGITKFPMTGGNSTDGFAFSASGTWWPSDRDKLEIGAFASINTSKNMLTQLSGIGRNYASYSTQLYWGPLPGDQPIRAKVDVIGISYQEVESYGAENFMGGSLFGGILLANHIEMFAMSEYWFGDGGSQESIGNTYLTSGLTYSLSALRNKPFQNNRITLAYSLRSQKMDFTTYENGTAHMIVIQSQFYF